MRAVRQRDCWLLLRDEKSLSGIQLSHSSAASHRQPTQGLEIHPQVKVMGFFGIEPRSLKEETRLTIRIIEGVFGSSRKGFRTIDSL